MSRLGQYLCKRGLLTRDQLQEALEHQAVYGARLGSNLVELRMITPERLAECLADLHHAPLPPRGWLERPGKAAIKRVTRPLVERIRFIPLRYIDKVLHVAVLDPNDPGVLDNLRFATGCRIKSYVMPEIWIHDWLFSLFQIPRGIRHIEVDYPPAQGREGETPLSLDLQAMQAAANAQAAQATANAQGPEAGQAQQTAQQAAQEMVKQTLQGKRPAPQQPMPQQPMPQAKPQAMPGDSEPPVQMPNAPMPNAPMPNVPPPMPFTADAPWTPGAMPPIPQMSVPGAFSNAGPGPGPVLDAFPTALGESVRPPQIMVRSLADLAGGASAFMLNAMAETAQRESAQHEPSPFPQREAAPFPQHEAGTSPLWAPAPADSRWLSVPRSEAPPQMREPEPERDFVSEQDAEQDAEPQFVAEPGSTFGYDEDPISETQAVIQVEYPEVYEPEPEFAPVFVPDSESDAEGESDTASESINASADDDEPLTLPHIMTPPPRVKSNVLSPSSFPRVEAAMMEVVDRDRLIELAFSIAACFSKHTGLFLVQQGTLQGLRYADQHTPPRPLEGAIVPAGADSMLTLVAREGAPLRANPEERVIDLRVRELLRDSQCREAGLFPIMIKQRVINVLYASNGDEPLGTIAFAALSALAERMGVAYEKLIRSRKVG